MDFLVYAGRILFLDDEQFADLAEAELKRAEPTTALSRETVKGADGKPVMLKDKAGHASPQRKIVFDPKKLGEYFARVHVGNRDVNVQLALSPTSPRIPIKLTPMPNAGETDRPGEEPRLRLPDATQESQGQPQGRHLVPRLQGLHPHLSRRPRIRGSNGRARRLGHLWQPLVSEDFARRVFGHFYTAAAPPPGGVPAVNIAPPKTTLGLTVVVVRGAGRGSATRP